MFKYLLLLLILLFFTMRSCETFVSTADIDDLNLYIDKKYGHTQGSSVSDKHRSLAQIYTQIEKFIV